MPSIGHLKVNLSLVLAGIAMFSPACAPKPEKVTVNDSGKASSDSMTSFTFKRGVNISHWLSQLGESRQYGADWFNAEDVAWIAAQGFDHLRLPVDGRLWLRPDGSLDPGKAEPFERAMQWARAHGLGTVLDMHFLPGADFNPQHQDNTLFTDPAKMEQVAEFWREVASRYADEGPWLRFELLNEPIAAENHQVNTFNEVMIAAVRESNPTRPIYITSNRWSNYKNVKDIDVPDDPYVFITFHFYEPFVFTHQRASWSNMPQEMPLIEFPGTVPDLSGHFSEDRWERTWSGRELSIAKHVEEPFSEVATWVAKHAADREIYVGEFGVYRPASDDSKSAYTAAIREACESRGWGWAVWDYAGSFGVRDGNDQPTAILHGLFDE